MGAMDRARTRKAQPCRPRPPIGDRGQRERPRAAPYIRSIGDKQRDPLCVGAEQLDPLGDGLHCRGRRLIAYLQWQTARQKVLLDLFDKRFAVYDELRSVVGRHLSSGIDQTALFEFKRVTSRAQFLFGPEVQPFLEERWVDLSRDMVERNNPQPQPVPEDQRAAAEVKLVARKDRLNDFFKDFDKLVAPYMNHHQKA
jgi:hypothetical protein